MFSSEDLKAIAAQAKQKLNDQQAASEAVVDMYAEFRDEMEEVMASPQEEVLPTLHDYQEEEYENVSLQHSPEEVEEEDIRLDPYDLAIFPDGPSRSEVELWKKEWEGHDVLAVHIQNEYFVIRSMNRFEYKKLVALENIDALRREEVICTNCTLFPYQYDFKKLAVARGGIPSTLAQIIMEASGFTQEYQIQML